MEAAATRAPALEEVIAVLEAMAREHAERREHVEVLAARIGLSADATAFALAECEQRCRVLGFAHAHFCALAAAWSAPAA